MLSGISDDAARGDLDHSRNLRAVFVAAHVGRQTAPPRGCDQEYGDGSTNPLTSRCLKTALSPPPRPMANGEDLHGRALDPVADEIGRHGDPFAATAADGAAALGVFRQARAGGRQPNGHALGGERTERADVAVTVTPYETRVADSASPLPSDPRLP